MSWVFFVILGYLFLVFILSLVFNFCKCLSMRLGILLSEGFKVKLFFLLLIIFLV